MRGGLIFAGLLTIVAVVAIAGLLYRPATVIGVSDKALAYSLRGAADGSETGACRGRDDRYVCTAFGAPPPGASGAGPRVTYAVTTDKYGCWDAKRGAGAEGSLAETLDGCITIVDLVRLDD